MAHFFLGEHRHSLDAKGRVILPARFREQLAEAFVTSEKDGCLALWPPAEFAERAQDFKDQFRSGRRGRPVARAFFAGAEAVSPDGQGRIALPANLRTFAHLEKDVVVIGAFDHVEIWDAATWEQEKQVGETGLASEDDDADDAA